MWATGSPHVLPFHFLPLQFLFYSSPQGFFQSDVTDLWPGDPQPGLVDSRRKRSDLIPIVPPVGFPFSSSLRLPSFHAVLLGHLSLWVQPEHITTVAWTANHRKVLWCWPLLRACEETLKIFKILQIICPVCHFQSRLRKKSEVKLFILSGLKNRKEKEAAGSVAAQRPSHLKGRVVTWGQGEAPENCPPHLRFLPYLEEVLEGNEVDFKVSSRLKSQKPLK